MKTVLDSGLELRPATSEDIPYIAGCIRETLTASVPDNETEMSELWAGTTVVAALDSMSSRKMEDEVFILTDGTGSKGMLWMGVSRDQYNSELTGYLLGIYVSEELRRRGIGRELIRCAESWCMDRDLLTMQLDVGASNTAALRLYESAGYGVRSSVLSKVLKR